LFTKILVALERLCITGEGIINTVALLAAEAFDLDQACARFAAKFTRICLSELKPMSKKAGINTRRLPASDRS
jgi:hypothetical protein